MTVICERCEDTGWVCEEHPTKCAQVCCGAVGIPCECNKADPPWHYVSPVEEIEDDDLD